MSQRSVAILKARFPAVALATLLWCVAARSGAAPPSGATFVKPIDWTRFTLPKEFDADTALGQKLMLNSARFCLTGPADAYPVDEQRGMYTIAIPFDQTKKKYKRHEDVFRPVSKTALVIAIALKTGAYDAQMIGVPREEALRRAKLLIKGMAARHRPHAVRDQGWGDEWQSALWGASLGEAAWLLWDDLDDECRQLTFAMIEHEADRFIAPDYHVPYWAKGDHVNTPGDTKAEENGWNSAILQVAVAMAPDHPRAKAWRRAASHLMISAYSLRSDDESNDTVLDGAPVKDWLDGFNVREDGVVENHSRIHPDYCCSIGFVEAAFGLMSLAGKSPPEAAGFNAPVVYRALVTRDWPSPPYKAPGGTIYRPGVAEIYYPQGTDWSAARVEVYYSLDSRAHLFGWDRGLPRSATSWMHLRGEHLLNKQSRNPDGRVYAPGEFDSYPAPNQNSAGTLSEAYLLQWLQACGQLNTKRVNWLAE